MNSPPDKADNHQQDKPHNLLAKISVISHEHKPIPDLNTVRAALRVLVKATLTELGCLGFNILESATQEGDFYLWESWLSKQALVDHYAAMHTRLYFSHAYTEVIEIIELSELSDLGKLIYES